MDFLSKEGDYRKKLNSESHNGQYCEWSMLFQKLQVVNV